jgi:hypothetical protein
MLKGSPLHQMVLATRKCLEKDFEQICKKFDQDEFIYEEFLNAKIAVSSRIFGIGPKGSDLMALVPYADMFNHNRPCQTKWYYDPRMKGFVVKAVVPLVRGE